MKSEDCLTGQEGQKRSSQEARDPHDHPRLWMSSEYLKPLLVWKAMTGNLPSLVLLFETDLLRYFYGHVIWSWHGSWGKLSPQWTYSCPLTILPNQGYNFKDDPLEGIYENLSSFPHELLWPRWLLKRGCALIYCSTSCKTVTFHAVLPIETQFSKKLLTSFWEWRMTMYLVAWTNAIICLLHLSDTANCQMTHSREDYYPIDLSGWTDWSSTGTQVSVRKTNPQSPINLLIIFILS